MSWNLEKVITKGMLLDGSDVFHIAAAQITSSNLLSVVMNIKPMCIREILYC